MTTSRHQGLDALRGWAIIAMVLYHFVFDLTIFTNVSIVLWESPWVQIRIAIVSAFLFGVGFASGISPYRSEKSFWRRWLEIVVASVLVSAGSYLMFPQSYIYFGVLHGIAVMLLLLRVTRRFVAWFPIWALFALIAWMTLKHPWFDAKMLHWLGLMTHHPNTMDYVPILPWMAMVWLGYYASTKSFCIDALNLIKAPHLLLTASRYPLSIYLLHQPILLAVLLSILYLKS